MRRRRSGRSAGLEGGRGPGRHETTLRPGGAAGGASVVVQHVIGRRRGPRVFLIGGLVHDDVLGLAVGRAVAEAVDVGELHGALTIVGRAAPAGVSLETAFALGADAAGDAASAALAREIGESIVKGAAFGVVIRSGPAGWRTFPHVRADLSDVRVRRLLRGLGPPVVVDAAGLRGSVRRVATRAGIPTIALEGGTAGEVDPDVLARATLDVLELLRANEMILGDTASAGRIVVGEVVRVRAPAAAARSRKGAAATCVVPVAAPGRVVKKRELLAEVFDEGGRLRDKVVAPWRGVVLSVPASARSTAVVARLGRVRKVTRPRAAAAHAADAHATAEHGRGAIGWCEWVAMPELGVSRLHAKIDTGARTSALHISSLKQVGESEGKAVCEIELPVARGSAVVARVVIEGHLVVRDSGGHAERRPVIETTLVLGGHASRVRVTLTDRGDMIFPMLVGRTALGEGVVVDPARRNVLGEPGR